MNEKEKPLSSNTKPLPSPSIFFMNPPKNSSLSIQPLNIQHINSNPSGTQQLQQQILPQYQIGQSTNFVNGAHFNGSKHYQSSQTGINSTIKSQKPIILHSFGQKVNNHSENVFQTNINNQINKQTDCFIPLNFNQPKNNLIENSSSSNIIDNKIFFNSVCQKINPKEEYRELKKKFKFLVYVRILLNNNNFSRKMNVIKKS